MTTRHAAAAGTGAAVAAGDHRMMLHWELVNGPDSRAVSHLATSLGLPPSIGALLIQRGIDTPDKAHAFLRPTIDQLHDPFRMTGMTAAVARLQVAITGREPVLICGDYDVDGVSATAVLYRVFRHMGVPVHYHVPERLTEGYGLSIEGIRRAKAHGIQVMVAVDCGTNAHDELAFARSEGIDCIVCDHHQPTPPLPQTVALLKPHRAVCSYPFRELSGAGIAFKLAQALVDRMEAPRGLLNECLELAALGTIADSVPLLDENRVIAWQGLRVINSRPLLGIAALLRAANVNGHRVIDTGQVLFTLAPRLNAAGRMDHAAAAVDLLVTADAAEARRLAQQLDAQNRERRRVDEQTTADAQAAIESECDPATDAVLVVARDGWHPGVIGIVASRMADRYHRPALMIAVTDGMGRGSARSIPGFDLYALVSACAGYTDSFGGHRYAAGFSIRADRIPAFRTAVRERAATMMTPDLKIRKLRIDVQMPLSDITADVLRHLRAFAPFGQQNPKPVLMAENLQVVGRPTIVAGNHLKFRVRQNGSATFSAIGFNKKDRLGDLESPAGAVDVAFHLDEDTWQGRTAPLLNVRDVHIGDANG